MPGKANKSILMKRNFTPITRFLAALALLELAILCTVGALQLEGSFPFPMALENVVIPLLIPVMGLGLVYFVRPLSRLMLQHLRRVYSAEDNISSLGLALAISLLMMLPTLVQAQSTCKEFIYVNEVSDAGRVHKFGVASANGALTEIKNNNAVWYPGTGTTELTNPHGLGVDRNGYLYIGSNFFTPNEIRRLDCAGNIAPSSTFSIPDIGELFNIDSYDGFIYSNGPDGFIYKFDPCTGAQIGYVELRYNSTTDWGFSIDDNGRFYVTDQNGRIWVFTPTAADFINHTPFDPAIDLENNTTLGGLLSPEYFKDGLQGITADEAGNIYVVEGNRDGPGTNSRLLKFSSTFAFLGASVIDNDGGDGMGWNQAVGIVYSKTSNRLYTTSLNAGEDCVYRWKTNLDPDGAAIGPVPGIGFAKGIAILSECCPVSNTINASSCGAKVGDRISLSDLLNANGVICEGQWTAVSGSSNLTFNDCDLTITVNALPACGSFTITNTGVTNAKCAPYTITLNVTALGTVTAQQIGGNQTVCPSDNPTAFTIVTPASTTPPGATITYQWQQSTTSCSDGFTNIPGAMSAMYDPGPVSQTTYYRVIASIAGCTDGVCESISNCVTLTLGTNCCSITSAGALATCNDNGTGTPSDDYFRLTTNPVGIGLGTQYNVTVVHNGNTTNYGPYSYGAASVSFGNFLISQGNATVTITGTCSLGPITVNAPAACSTCNITSAGALATCNDNGTGTPTDDFFRLTTNPVGAGVGSQYNVTVVHNGNTTT